MLCVKFFFLFSPGLETAMFLDKTEKKMLLVRLYFLHRMNFFLNFYFEISPYESSDKYWLSLNDKMYFNPHHHQHNLGQVEILDLFLPENDKSLLDPLTRHFCRNFIITIGYCWLVAWKFTSENFLNKKFISLLMNRIKFYLVLSVLSKVLTSAIYLKLL